MFRVNRKHLDTRREKTYLFGCSFSEEQEKKEEYLSLQTTLHYRILNTLTTACKWEL